MNRSIRALLVAMIPLSFVRATETATWDTANNAVTYAVSVDHISLGTDPVYVALSQFNAAAAATQEGGSAGDFTLTRVILSLDGSVYGSILFQNNGPVAVSPTYDFSGYSRLTYGGYSTGREYYDGNIVSLGTVASGSQVSSPVSSSGDGAVSTPDITTALSSFIGGNTITTSVFFPVGGLFGSAGTDFTTTLALQGLANVSVTYYYDQVPEPSALALVSFGCAAILTRRRFKKITA